MYIIQFDRFQCEQERKMFRYFHSDTSLCDDALASESFLRQARSVTSESRSSRGDKIMRDVRGIVSRFPRENPISLLGATALASMLTYLFARSNIRFPSMTYVCISSFFLFFFFFVSFFFLLFHSSRATFTLFFIYDKSNVYDT